MCVFDSPPITLLIEFGASRSKGWRFEFGHLRVVFGGGGRSSRAEEIVVHVCMFNVLFARVCVHMSIAIVVFV